MKPKSFATALIIAFIGLIALLLPTIGSFSSAPAPLQTAVAIANPPAAAQSLDLSDIIVAGSESLSSDNGASLASTGEDESFPNFPNNIGAKLKSFRFETLNSLKYLVANVSIGKPANANCVAGISFDKITDEIPGVKGQRILWSETSFHCFPASMTEVDVYFPIVYAANGMPECRQLDVAIYTETKLKEDEQKIYAAYDKGEMWFNPTKTLLGAFHFRKGTCDYSTTTPTPSPSATPSATTTTAPDRVADGIIVAACDTTFVFDYIKLDSPQTANEPAFENKEIKNNTVYVDFVQTWTDWASSFRKRLSSPLPTNCTTPTPSTPTPGPQSTKLYLPLVFGRPVVINTPTPTPSDRCYATSPSGRIQVDYRQTFNVSATSVMGATTGWRWYFNGNLIEGTSNVLSFKAEEREGILTAMIGDETTASASCTLEYFVERRRPNPTPTSTNPPAPSTPTNTPVPAPPTRTPAPTIAPTLEPGL